MSGISTAAWRVLAAVFIVGTVNFMDRALLSIAIPGIRQEFAWTASVAGLALSSFLWTYAISSAVVAPFVDRFGPRRSQAVAMGFWAVSLLWTAATRGFVSLIGSRALLGVAEAPNQPIALLSVRSFFPAEHIGFACSVAAALVVRVGPIMGFMVGGALIEGLGWRGAFVALAGLSIAAIPLWLLLYPKVPVRSVASTGGAAGEAWRFFRYPRFWAVMVGMTANSYIQYLFFTWTPGYLSSLFKTNIMNIGFMSAAIFGFGVLGNLLGGWGGDMLIRRGYYPMFARKGLILAGLLLSSPIVCVTWFDGMVGTLFILSVADFGINVAVPQFWAIITDTAPRHLTATYTGVVNGVANAGGLAAPILTGFILQATGSFAMSFGLAGVMLAICGVCWLLCLRRIEPLYAAE